MYFLTRIESCIRTPLLFIFAIARVSPAGRAETTCAPRDNTHTPARDPGAIVLAARHDVRRLAAPTGPVDILANNVGVYKFRRHRRDHHAFFDRDINLNLRAPYILVQKLEPGMAERGRGVVVNLSTVAVGRRRDLPREQRERANVLQAGTTETRDTAATPGRTDTFSGVETPRWDGHGIPGCRARNVLGGATCSTSST